MRRILIYGFLLAAFLCVVRTAHAQDALGDSDEADGTPYDGSDDSWDTDFDDPFSVTDAIYGFPHVPMFGLVSLSFTIPSVANNTSSNIVAQVYLSLNISPVNNNSQHSNMLNRTYLPISGCTVTVKAKTNGPVSQSCNVSASDNALLTSLGIINTAQAQQVLGLGFGKLPGSPSGVPYPAMGLTFSSSSGPVSLDLGIITLGSCASPVTYVGGGGAQFSSQCGADVGPSGQAVTATPSIDSPWLSVIADGTTEPATLTISANAGSMPPAEYTGSILVTSATGSATVGVVMLILPTATGFIQQGPKLTGNDSGNPNPAIAMQGRSVALSSDGNTMIVGGPGDNNNLGAAWIFTRSSGVWSQQFQLDVSSAPSGTEEGYSVGLSADGNTAIVGGPFNSPTNQAAAWIFTRSGGLWNPQGPPLFGQGGTGSTSAEQGYSVAISGDGNTAIVGGLNDNNNLGATWVFTRSNGVWSPQGSKLVPNDASGKVFFGGAVGLSGDGNTAVIGGYGYSAFNGAIWIFTRSGGTWTQQGTKLTDVTGVGSIQGTSVAISADGNTAIAGGYFDSHDTGAAWVYTRAGTTWSQQTKLVGGNGLGTTFQGFTVALSANGNTAVVGGFGDNNSVGAAWVFTRSGTLWSPPGGTKLSGTNSVGAAQQSGVAVSGDGSTIAVGGFTDNSNIGAAWPFVLSGGLPTVTNTSPPAVTSGAPAFTLTVNGSNFRAGASISWNNSPLTSTLISATQMTAFITANLLVATHAVITVSNIDGTSVNFQVTVNPALSLTTTSLPAGTVGIPYSATISSTGGTAPYTICPPSGICSQLPPGLSYAQQQGSLSITGTPTTPGTYMFAYTVTDSSGATASNTYSTTIAPGTTGITIQTSPEGFQFTIGNGQPLTAPQTVSLTQGQQYTIAVTSPQSLPGGAQYAFSKWSDGGAISHMISVGTSAATYIATFIPSSVTVSGNVSVKGSGAALSGVTITVSGSQSGPATTDASGNYSITLGGGGTYTLSASLPGYSFSAPVTFTNLIANQTANFNGIVVTNDCIGMFSSATNLMCSPMTQGAFQGNLAISIGAQVTYYGAMTLVGQVPFNDAAGMALYNSGGGGGASVSLDLYNTSFNNGIPQAKIKAIDDGNYSDNLTFLTKTPGGPGNAVAERVRITSTGNVGIGTGNPTRGPLQMGSGAFVSAGGVWTNASDRNLKENFVPVEPAAILQKIDALPLTEWNYKNENPSVRHVGPVAQDFFSIFGVGNSSTSISTIDPSGIALAGIQGLDEKSHARADRLAELKRELAAKTEELRSLEERLAHIESLLEQR